jgi:uncharacterized protein YqhQ
VKKIKNNQTSPTKQLQPPSQKKEHAHTYQNNKHNEETKKKKQFKNFYLLFLHSISFVLHDGVFRVLFIILILFFLAE